jgi:phage baseplate assembly protein W
MTEIREKVEVPHLSFPFRMSPSGRSVAVDEQDSSEEVVGCVQTLFLTEPGFRIDRPEFGVDDQTFREGGADLNELASKINQWEPRASDDVERLGLDEFVDRVRVGRSSG